MKRRSFFAAIAALATGVVTAPALIAASEAKAAAKALPPKPWDDLSGHTHPQDPNIHSHSRNLTTAAYPSHSHSVASLPDWLYWPDADGTVRAVIAEA